MRFKATHEQNPEQYVRYVMQILSKEKSWRQTQIKKGLFMTLGFYKYQYRHCFAVHKIVMPKFSLSSKLCIKIVNDYFEVSFTLLHIDINFSYQFIFEENLFVKQFNHLVKLKKNTFSFWNLPNLTQFQTDVVVFTQLEHWRKHFHRTLNLIPFIFLKMREVTM